MNKICKCVSSTTGHRTTTPKPTTTRRPLLPLFDLEENDEDDEERAFKKERAASRLEPSRTTPFR